jgi:hypothetical protein
VYKFVSTVNQARVSVFTRPEKMMDQEALTTRLNQMTLQLNQLQQRHTDTEQRNFKMALNHLPRYSGGRGEMSFRDHILQFRTWLDVEEITSELRKKKALVWSLTGQAMARIRHVGFGSRVFQEAASVEAYIKFLFTIFEPDSERSLARIEFAGYRQAPQEDIGNYLAQKLDLWRIAYLQEEDGMAPPFTMLLAEVIKGIHSKVVKRLVTRAAPTDEESLRKACLEAVSSERFAFINGYAESTSLDGLSSVYRGNQRQRLGEQPRELSSEEPMEVDSIFHGKCRKCRKPGHMARDCPQKSRPGSLKKDDKSPAGLGRQKRREDRRQGKDRKMDKDKKNCYFCDKPGHFKRDCLQLKKEKISSLPEVEEEDEDDFYIFSINNVNQSFLA